MLYFIRCFCSFFFFFSGKGSVGWQLGNSGGPVGATETKRILKLVKRGERSISLTSTTRGEEQCRVYW